MILVIAATEMELADLRRTRPISEGSVRYLVAGVGMLETGVRLTRYLQKEGSGIHLLLNIGIGGAFVQPAPVSSPQLLDICIARKEVNGDFGIALNNRVTPLDPAFGGGCWYPLKDSVTEQTVLESGGFRCHAGNFVTVNSVSGSAERGEYLRKQWDGICENMEGAAVARIGLEFHIPCLEIRAVSNLVEDRDRANWPISDAVDRVTQATKLLLDTMVYS